MPCTCALRSASRTRASPAAEGDTVRSTRIPNALTALRILLVPVLLALLPRVPDGAGPWSRTRLPVVGLFFLLAATDWLDGYLARRLGATSRWGSLADAVADRLALLLPLLYLALRPDPAFSPTPLWIPLWLIGLDAVAGLAWLVARSEAPASPSVSHLMVGRVAVWLLFMLVLWILLGLPFPGVLILGLAGLTLASVSAALHTRRWLRGTVG